MFKALLLAGVVFTLAHSAPSGWSYGNQCCNPVRVTPDGTTGDCAPIPARTVRVTPTGYVVALAPGDHPLVIEPIVFKIAFAAAKVSGDEEYHICLYPMWNNMRCFFAPPRGA